MMDLTFHTPEGRFNYRVGAVILRNSAVLLMHNEKEAYYYTVGGRVQYGETSQQALIREIREELGIEMQIVRPLCFHETFYDEPCTGEFFHEIAVYYLMEDTPDLDCIHCESVTELGASETLHWLPLNRLDEVEVVPKGVVESLKDLSRPMSVVVDDLRTESLSPFL